MSKPGGLRLSHIPATLEEARRLVAYNQDVIDRSASYDRIVRARRMLENLRPHIERLERMHAARSAAVLDGGYVTNAGGIEVVWSGAISRITGLQPSDLASA